MRTDTNMAWPDDPYGTGQLWRKEPLLLSGFAIRRMADDHGTWPVSYAVVYLRLHRTQVIDLTSGVSFGFRSVTIETTDELEHLLRLFDLDTMRARRLAKIVAGWRLRDELEVMQALTAKENCRGIHGLAESWLNRDNGDRALAHRFDVAYDQAVPTADLATAAISNEIEVAELNSARNTPDSQPLPISAATMERLAIHSTVNALICALIAGRTLNRFTWEGSLDIGEALMANAGDCFAFLNFMNHAQPGSKLAQDCEAQPG